MFSQSTQGGQQDLTIFFKGISRVFQGFLTSFQGFSRLKIKGSQGFLMKFYKNFQRFSRVLTKKIQGFFQGIFKTKTSIPWNNEPAPFGSLSAIFLGTKKHFF